MNNELFSILKKSIVDDKQIKLWRDLKLIVNDDISHIKIEDICNYSYASFIDIECYFACSRSMAKKLWHDNVIQAFKMEVINGTSTPYFIWKDILSKEDQIITRIERSLGNNYIIHLKNKRNLVFKQIESITKDFNIQKNMIDVIEEEKMLFGIYNKINKLLVYIKHNRNFTFYFPLIELLEQVIAKIKMNADDVLNHFNIEFNTQFKYEDFIKSKDLYESIGISTLIESKGLIKHIFKRLFEDLIPSHPKDEYPVARQNKRTVYIHYGPTNSGKTFKSLERLKNAEKGIYLGPLRLLALEIYTKLNNDGIPCHLITGEEEILHEHAKHTSATIETLNVEESYDVAVIDEAQMITDRERGNAWTKAILGLNAKEIHICCSFNVKEVISRLLTDCGDSIIYQEHVRETELKIERSIYHFPESIMDGDALIVFSRRRVIHIASILEEKNIKCSMIYGDLPPETRLKQINLFLQGETKVIVSTDAIGMGLNLPIRRVVFLECSKYVDKHHRALNKYELLQIAGRAGRKNIYDIGYVNAIHSKKYIKETMNSDDVLINHVYVPLSHKLILELPFGSLHDRLKAWKHHQYQSPFFKKESLEHLFYLLHSINHLTKNGDNETIFKLITIPFNYNKTPLYDLWKQYCDCIINQKTLFRPLISKCLSHELEELELYYRKLNIYHFFCKRFNVNDSNWISEERINTSHKIFLQLKNNIHQYKYVCKVCKMELPWDSIYSMCNSCYMDKYLNDFELL